MVVVANVWGLLTGEWKNADRRAFHYLGAGIVLHHHGFRGYCAGRVASAALYLPEAATRTAVQCAQRLAARGISLRHSGHCVVVGAAAGGAVRARYARIGTTTKKYTALPTSRNEITASINSP